MAGCGEIEDEEENEDDKKRPRLAFRLFRKTGGDLLSWNL
jgi:hypothetical protein